MGGAPQSTVSEIKINCHYYSSNTVFGLLILASTCITLVDTWLLPVQVSIEVLTDAIVTQAPIGTPLRSVSPGLFPMTGNGL